MATSISRLLLHAATLIVVAVLLMWASGRFEATFLRDDSDPPDGNSGMKPRTDHRTGCQYLTTSYGGITPRLDHNGKHICEGGK